jgi:hypothetical protein
MVFDGEHMYLAEYNAGTDGEHKMYQMDMSFNVIRTWTPPLPPSGSKGGVNDIADDGTHIWESECGRPKENLQVRYVNRDSTG